MTSKQLVYEEIKQRTLENNIEENEIFTANDLATSLNLSRNTVSQYLNEGLKDESIVKVNSRPVYFFDKSALIKKWNVRFIGSEFASFNLLMAQKEHDFDQLIGYNGSLSSIIEQCKAAMCYPDNGLPIMIYGPTGTGKTLLANTMYDYALHQGVIESNSRFVSVNCSEYANNPELLTSNLFGHVKGAYTSAEEDQDGLISLANGGVLFLDEVHCLKAECQEKLFQFMDKGIYHKVGDNDKWYKSKCRLIFATTENPQDALLKTLLRRIPITVSVPSLKDRPLLEKRELIYRLLEQEEAKLGKDMYISNLAYSTFLDYEFKGNIGELKNTIKATCAKGLLNQSSDILQIHLLDLPSYFFETIKSMQLKTHSRDNETLFSIHDLKGELKPVIPLLQFYAKLLNAFEGEEDFSKVVDQSKVLIQNFIDYLFFKQKYTLGTTNEVYLLKIVDKIYSIVMNKYAFVVPNSKIKMYSKLFMEYGKDITDTKIWIASNYDSIMAFSTQVRRQFPRAYSIAQEIIENIALNLDIQMDEFMQVVITLTVANDDKIEHNGTVGLILCHGYSTASSIADTVNHILNQHVFDGMDMEVQISIDKMCLMVDDYLRRKAPVKELMLMVDMGSLEDIYERINPLSDCNIGIINNVSTASALEVGNLMKQHMQARQIIKTIKENYEMSYQFIESKQKTEAILTVCATGFGSAKKIGELLKNSLPKSIPLEIIPYDYQSLVTHGIEDNIFSEYDVKMLIGTLDPKVPGVKYMPMENIVTNDEVHYLHELIGKYLSDDELRMFNENIAKNFTLDNIVNHLTILNPQKVMEDVEEIVSELEKLFKCSLDITTKVGVYVHLSCLIERLILRQGIAESEGMEDFAKKYPDLIESIKDIFSGVEYRYSVEIPIPEIRYLLNYFNFDE